jgi:aspartate kinase
MIVMKFGGTSLESAAAIERLAAIVRTRIERRPVVVVSAMGKTTNRLLEIARSAVGGRGKEAVQQIHELHDFHLREARQVVSAADRAGLDLLLDEHFQELTELVKGLVVLGEATPRSIDVISSYGERLSSQIVTRALRHFGIDSAHLESRSLLVTDNRFNQATPLYGPTRERLAQRLPVVAAAGKVAVLGGFIGATEDGVTTTLGRGGSDFSASIIGAGIGAEEIQIWTDVDGMLTCDPALVPEARRVKVISFSEAAELAYFGAKVLHPSTLLPAMENNIPVRILNSQKPECEGTLIVAQAPPTTNLAKSIACKKNLTVVDISSTRMLMAHGFLHKIFEVFDRYETPVDMVTTSEVSVSLTIDSNERLAEITGELSRFAEVRHENHQAVICVVGDNIRYTPGVAGRIFKAVEDVNVRMISQGASLRNVSFVVQEADLKKAVQALHRAFFSELDAETFA